jgi:hypothetical protein
MALQIDDFFENLTKPDVLADEVVSLGTSYDFTREEIDQRGDLGDFWGAVKYFANSNLPNSYFLQQFFPPYPRPFCQSEYWHGFAAVLAYRGIDKIDDVKEDIFYWFQDGNWAGNEIILPFVLRNKDKLKSSFVNVIWKVFDIGDTVWFCFSFEVYKKFYNLKNIQLSELIERIDYYHVDLETWEIEKRQFESDLARLFPRNQNDKPS